MLELDEEPLVVLLLLLDFFGLLLLDDEVERGAAPSGSTGRLWEDRDD